MSDVTADGGTRHRPRATLVPVWHHVDDETGAGPAPEGAPVPDDATPRPGPEPPARLAPMQEGRRTADGVGHDVGRPFMVLATQNPIEQAGTYRLPEAQLDRFLMKASIGYPDHASTVEILSGASVRDRSKTLQPLITTQAVTEMAELGARVHVDGAVLEYVSRLAEETRNAPEVRVGVSVRGALALVRCAKVWAAAHGRNYVLPDDVKELAQPTWAHRLVLDPEAEFAGATNEAVLGRLLADVAAPQERRSA